MLGYVKIFKPELKVKEYEIYCGYYCGICKSIGKRYGQLPRMVLSYDAAFLAILLEGLSSSQDTPLREHCIAHPFIKKKTIIRNSAIDYAADVMLMLAWYKLQDDINDEGKFYAKGTMMAYRRMFKTLQRQYPELCTGIEYHLKELSELEKNKCANIDAAAEAFSKIMELIFAKGEEVVASLTTTTIDSGSTLGSIGYHMGKWIYLIDAIDDIEENLSTGAYNPLFYRFGFDNSRESTADFRERIKDDLNFNLYHYLAVISNHLEAIDIKKNKGIIENIIYFGLNRKTQEVVSNTDKKERI